MGDGCRGLTGGRRTRPLSRGFCGLVSRSDNDQPADYRPAEPGSPSAIAARFFQIPRSSLPAPSVNTSAFAGAFDANTTSSLLGWSARFDRDKQSRGSRWGTMPQRMLLPVPGAKAMDQCCKLLAGVSSGRHLRRYTIVKVHAQELTSSIGGRGSVQKSNTRSLPSVSVLVSSYNKTRSW